MLSSLGRTYVRLLFGLQLLLLMSSVLLHGAVLLLGAIEPYVIYVHIVFAACVFITVPVFAFVKDGLWWIHQIKSCPKWLWRASLAAGIYSWALAVLGLFDADTTVVQSGFPIGFEAISVCILYAVLFQGYLGNAEVARRFLYSLTIAAIMVTIVLLYRAGFLPRRAGYLQHEASVVVDTSPYHSLTSPRHSFRVTPLEAASGE